MIQTTQTHTTQKQMESHDAKLLLGDACPGGTAYGTAVGRPWTGAVILREVHVRNGPRATPASLLSRGTTQICYDTLRLLPFFFH